MVRGNIWAMVFSYNETNGKIKWVIELNMIDLHFAYTIQ